MPQKLLRIGFTESILLFIYWLNTKGNNELDGAKRDKIKWLYTTSGYYDKTQVGNYFNVTHSDGDTEVYHTYMRTILDFIKHSDICAYTMFVLNDFSSFKNELNEFRNLLNSRIEGSITRANIYSFIENRKILIISPFAPLMKSQIESGNCKKIFDTFPQVDNIAIYKFPYTFFNNGPDNNILETNTNIFNDIIHTVKDEYESILISCGAYSNILAKKFYDMGKNVCTIGGELQGFFGILSKREKFYNKLDDNVHLDYWITSIPDEYKPHDYMKIEDGCYW